MSEAGIRDAKMQLFRLLRRVAMGDELIITNRGVPAARLLPTPTKNARRKLGIFAALFKDPDAFDAPVQNVALDAFAAKPSSTELPRNWF
jgi:prevent-host-death family protein